MTFLRVPKPWSHIVAAMAAGLLTCLAVPVQAKRTDSVQESVPVQKDLRAQVDAYMRAAVANDQFTGAVLVARDGVPLIDTAYGMARCEMPWRRAALSPPSSNSIWRERPRRRARMPVARRCWSLATT